VKPFSNNGHANIIRELEEPYETVAAKAAARDFRLDSLPCVLDMDVSIEWLIRDFLVDGAMTLITGDSGVGKSTLALALAGAVAQGKPFLGYAAKQKRVLYVDGENPAAAVRERMERLSIPRLGNLDIWGGWCREHPPAGPSCTPVLEWASKHTGLIIYDSLIQFHPGSEQDASETRKYMDHFRKLVNAGCTVLLLHHVGKSENAREYRGSSDIKASSDQAFCLESIGQSEEGRSALRLLPFKSRMVSLNPLRFEMTDSGFQVNAYSGPTNREIVEQVIEKNPGKCGVDLVKLAAARGVTKNRAEAVLVDGARDGWLIVDLGFRNKKHYRLREPND
jgi:archaellum biogenesis ATPase FlaH